MSVLSMLAQTSSDFNSLNTDYSYSTTSTEVDPAAAAAGLMIMFVILGFVFLFIVIPQIISFWKLFTKAGEPGWAALIPIYNTYVMNKIGGGPIWYFILALLPTVNIVGVILILVELSKKYDKPATVWLASFIPIISVFMVGKTSYIGNTPTTSPEIQVPQMQQPPQTPPVQPSM